ncbi:MAG TPA: response regulator transcription factor [Blastococcus sp.]|nr:response regulator transcription factor [Blastococcus sp.]
MTSVVIADDQELIRSGLRLVLEARGVDVLAEAADGRQAVAAVGRLRPDVVLMDIRMPRMDGIAATRELTRVASGTRVLVLTTYDLDEYVYGALRAGAAGFLLKSTPPDRLVDGIAVVAAGDALLAPALTRRLIEEHIRRPLSVHGVPGAVRELTAREREVLVLVARGLSNTEIAERLVLGEATVKTHVNRILTKLALRGRAQAVVLAYESGLVTPGTEQASGGQVNTRRRLSDGMRPLPPSGERPCE